VQLLGLFLCLTSPLHAAPVVVTSIKPLQLIAAAITDGISTPELVMDAGQDPHHVTLRPSDRRKLQQADVVLWIGPALELPLQDVMEELAVPVLTAQHLPQVLLLESKGATDPHLWLDTRNARHIASALVDALQPLDPANAQRYAANLAAFAQALAATDEKITTVLHPYRTTAWSASHEAFGYFIAQFGLPLPVTLTNSSNEAPGVRRVVELREAILAQQIKCLLTEASENPAQLDALLDGTALHVVQADVLGNGLPDNASGYAQLMLALADNVAVCLAGDAR
jgi:zinc transport system substrate-binding protein